MELGLDEIGQKHGTDKMSGVSAKLHGYLPHYEFFFRHLRHDAITLCEIGVYKGASLATWREYFSRARIVGVDINPDTLQYRTEGVDVEIVDQADKHQLASFAEEYGPFDIVVDDGSHRWDHQRISIANLIWHLKPGGFYVIEDIHTSFIDRYKGKDDIPFVDRLLSLSRHLVDPSLNPIPVDDKFLQYISGKIASISFIKRAAILRIL